jgi:hypothetical protein
MNNGMTRADRASIETESFAHSPLYLASFHAFRFVLLPYTRLLVLIVSIFRILNGGDNNNLNVCLQSTL